MDFKQAKRNRKYDTWLMVLLLLSLATGLNFLVSKIDTQLDLSPGSKHTLSRETLALLNQMESPVDIVITIQEDNELPKVIQKLLHDLGLLLESFENSASSKKIRVHRVERQLNQNVIGGHRQIQDNGSKPHYGRFTKRRQEDRLQA